MKTLPILALVLLLTTASLAGKKPEQAKTTPAPAAQRPDISGMYTFLRDGEFVQVNIEEAKVSGFVSRYGDRESDEGVFLDQFFSKAAYDGLNFSFTTRTVHGTWFEFKGTVSRGEAKSRAEEGYYVIQGTLTEHVASPGKNDPTTRQREITMKLFPEGEDLPGKKP